MNINLDPGSMQALVSKAIIDALTPEKREELLTNAIKGHLLAPQDNPRGFGSRSGRSPLQEAFDQAVWQVARDYANKHLAEDAAFRTQVEALFRDVAAKLFAEESRETLVSTIASTIREAMTKERY